MQLIKINSILKNMLSELKHIISNHKFECIVCLLGMLLSCVIFRYGDGLSLTAWSIEVYDAFFRGGFNGFGSIMSQNLWGAPHGVLSGFYFPSFVHGLWNLPLLIIHYIFDTDYVVTAPMYIWSKLGLAFVVFATGYICYKIVVKITEKKERGVIAFFLVSGSCTTMLISVAYSGQDEVIYFFFLMLGLYDAISNRLNRSLISLTIASVLCPAVLIFTALIVISSSRKFFEVIWRLAIIFASVVITSSGSSVESGAGGYLEWYFGRSLFYVGNSSISLLAALIVFIYLFQLFIKRKDDERNIYTIYSLALVSLAVCTFSWLHFYRFFICIPFMVLSILIVKDDDSISPGMVGLCVFEYFKCIIAMSDVNCINLGNTFDYVNNLLGYGIPVNQSLYEIVCAKFPIFSQALPILGGAALLSGIWVLYVAYPKSKQRFIPHIPLRFITIVWTMGTLLISLVTVFLISRITFINTNIEGDGRLANPITDTAYLEEYYKGKPASQLSISVRPITWGKIYPEQQKVICEIVDAETNEVIGSTECSPNDFIDNSLYTFKISNLNIVGGKWYVFRFRCENSGNSEENGVYFLCSYSGTADSETHYATYILNGETFVADYDYVNSVYAI